MSDLPTIHRHWILLRILTARRHGATLRELAEEGGVSQKTIQRDLEMLKQLGFDLRDTVADHGRKHWKLADSGGLLQLKLTTEEAAAIYLGRQFLEPLAGTLFFQGAQSAFHKIKATLGDAPLRHLEKLAAAFYCKTHGMADYSDKGQFIDDLERAIEDHKLTVITYHSLRSTEPVTHYDVHPYSLVWHKRALYLLAWSCDHSAIRTFKIDRLSAVDVQPLAFQRPANFDAATFLAGSLGIFQGDGPLQTVLVRFSAQVARNVSETTHHSSQQLTPQPDGTLLAQFELASLEELQSWLLSFGPHVEVLEPEFLRKNMVASLRETLLHYETQKSRSAPAK
ncbi:helix-turn-helix transcriptional regulator [Anatilimnocola sp. NA78]|uniref:helix-turn-helix transcriptional regulator n=1 Tax=Anatilimnocola sp. NA78 TaxID=3415683 RepID=UPI003CE51ED1